MASFEVGAKRRGMPGLRFSFVGHSPRIDSLDFLISDQNQLTLKALDRRPVHRWTEVYSRLDPIQGPLDTQSVERAVFEPFANNERPRHRFNFGDPVWCQQSVDYSSEGFRFVAQYDSSYFFGRLYLFYNPNSHIMRQVFQCS